MFRIAFPKMKDSNPYYYNSGLLLKALDLARQINDFSSENGIASVVDISGGHRNKTGYDTVIEVNTESTSESFSSILKAGLESGIFVITDEGKA
ncbi:MAG: hypothetical protein M0Q94_13675 [Candidatus Cloacimonetes bacterium]|nr:hypothetical protein [Candidatus Cloacimonadota bacterium]